MRDYWRKAMFRIKQYTKDILATTVGTMLNVVFSFEEPLVLNYHGITDVDDFDMKYVNDVRYRDFVKQITILRELKYNIVSLNEFIHLSEDGELTASHCLITFDDVPASFCKAADYLISQNLPFAVFVCSDYANKGKPNWAGWDLLKNIDKTGMVGFGTHSTSHPNMKELDVNSVHNEIEKSMKIVKSNLVHVNDVFAFPYGQYSRSLIDTTRKVGIDFVFLTDCKLGRQTLARLSAFRRIPIGSYDSERIFMKKIRGKYRYF